MESENRMLCYSSVLSPFSSSWLMTETEIKMNVTRIRHGFNSFHSHDIENVRQEEHCILFFSVFSTPPASYHKAGYDFYSLSFTILEAYWM